MFALLSKPRRQPASRRPLSPRRLFESLEARLCLAAPTIEGFSAVEGVAKNVTLSGYVTDESPATVQVNFSGVVTGGTTPNAQGFFQFSGLASALGTVSAVGRDIESLVSNTAQTQVTSLAPSVTFSVTESGANRQVTVSGQVTDASPGGLTVTFSGVVSGSVVTDPTGSFSLTTQATGLGTATATTTDVWGIASSPAQATLQSAAPRIENFGVIEHPADFWEFRGTVVDEQPDGLTVVFEGVIAGNFATVNADGSFSIIIFLDPSVEGLATAITMDWWGLESNEAATLVHQT